MGPIIIFDKSTLQSLSVDEAVWFDNYFLTNLCPLFYIETLADLEKGVRNGRTPEQEVQIIADKTDGYLLIYVGRMLLCLTRIVF